MTLIPPDSHNNLGGDNNKLNLPSSSLNNNNNNNNLTISNINDSIRDRKESTSSLRTTTTNGGGQEGNSIYESAVEGSQTTFTKSELGHDTLDGISINTGEEGGSGGGGGGGGSGRTSRADGHLQDDLETPTQSRIIPNSNAPISDNSNSTFPTSSALPITQAIPVQTSQILTLSNTNSTSPEGSNHLTNSSTSGEKAGTSSSISVSERGSRVASNNNDEKNDDSTKIDLESDPDMAHLNEYQRKIVEEQVKIVKGEPVSFKELFRFSTRFEIGLNVAGIIAAIVAGAAQPLMTVVFGSLTTAFVSFNTAVLQAQDGTPASIAAVVIARDHLYSTVNQDVLYLVYIGIAMFLATYIYMWTFIYTGEKARRRISEAYLKAVLRQNIAYFDKLGAGEVTTRIQTDIDLIQEGISDKIPLTVMFLAIFIVGFIVAFVRNWRLALVVSTIVPAIALAGTLMNKYMSEFRRKMLIETAEAGTLVEEVVSSIRNTHAFGTQTKLAAMYDVRNLNTLNLGLASAKFNGAGMMIFFFIIYCAYALAFYYGTTLILQGNADAGQILNVILAVLIGAFSLAQIAPNMQSLSFAMGAATSIFATIDRIPVIDSSSPAGESPSSIEGTLQFNSVDFLYPARPSVQVLHNFTATFPKGKMTALVGASGSGKSTLIGLTERFYDPVGGNVELDGIDLKSLNVKWLRTQIGLVSQEPTLFATTVAKNIEHGLIGTEFDGETGEERRNRVVEAAKLANADGFIRALPESYDTLIGERGSLLSGGQKQRIAIARAVIGNPQILLLDEATSALDTASEGIVQDALDRASGGRTTITIAHRLSTIKDADQIIVLSAGVILESAMTEGNRSAHVELLSRDGAYSRLVSAQRFREKSKTDEDEDDEAGDSNDESGNEKSPISLTREEVDEMAKNEKPQLGRKNTNRSITSEIIKTRMEEDLEKNRGKKPHSFFYLIYRILQLNSNQKWTYFAGVVASITVGLSYPIFSIVLGGVVGAFSLQGDALRHEGDKYAGLAFAIAVVSALGVGVQSYSFGASSEKLSRVIRVGTFAAIMRQDIAYFDKDENSTGVLTSAVSNYAQKIQGLFGVTAGVIIQSGFTLLAGSIIGLSYAWKVSLVGIACYPFTIAAGVVRLKVVVLKDAKNKKAHEASAQMACEATAAIRTVASLTREEDCCEIYSSYLDEPQRQSERTAIFANAYFSLSQALTFWVIGLIFYYGAHQLASGAINSKQFFVSLISIVFASIQAGQVFTYVPDMSKARGAASDVITLLDAVPEIDALNPVGEKLQGLQGGIKFEDVHFRYPSRPHVRVLRGLNLEVKPGQFVAIVGPSGCGKSTLIQLVERFYDPLSGAVKVDGHDISELDIKVYRDQISLVSQEPTLYAGSVRFNITLGATIPADQVSQEAVEQACRDANIHEFVMSLPDGYDTDVGGKGTQLSGGQKQRIAIARALIRNPKILLLDEATSALDSESEKVVQIALDEAAKGRSTIAVAHRLSTIQGADIIYVLRDGKVAEQGKHFELLARNGIYAELVSQQNLEKRK